MFKSLRTSKSLSSVLAGLVLLSLMQLRLSSADTPAAPSAAGAGGYDPAGGRASVDDAYASEVPREAIDSPDQPTLASDEDEQSIPVAEEIDFVKDNSFRKPFEERLKTVAKVDYYGTRYVDCEWYPLEVHTAPAKPGPRADEDRRFLDVRRQQLEPGHQGSRYAAGTWSRGAAGTACDV